MLIVLMVGDGHQVGDQCGASSRELSCWWKMVVDALGGKREAARWFIYRQKKERPYEAGMKKRIKDWAGQERKARYVPFQVLPGTTLL
jgi:hypothetical protein